MSTLFPTNLDSPTDPIASNTLDNPSHSAQHSFENDAIVALETKVGINASADTTSMDYKLSGVPATDKVASKTGTETLTNKTLTSPVINLGSDATGDLYTRSSGGALQRVPIGSAGQVLGVSAGLPAYIPNPAASNGSTSNTGVYQEATQAQVDAGTTTGSTGADLTIRPDTLRAKQYNSYVADTGSANAYAIAPLPAITAYATGQVFTFKAVNANTTASTLAVSGLASPVAIKKNGSVALISGDIAAGQIVTVVYDGTNFQMISPLGNPNVLAVGFKNGTTTKNAADASTAQTIAHGLGVIPKYVRLWASSKGISGAGDSIPAFANAVYNGTTQSSQSFYSNSGSGFASGGGVSDNSFTLNVSGAAGTQVGVVTFDATNITITWTKTNSPTGTYQILWEAYA